MPYGCIQVPRHVRTRNKESCECRAAPVTTKQYSEVLLCGVLQHASEDSHYSTLPVATPQIAVSKPMAHRPTYDDQMFDHRGVFDTTKGHIFHMHNKNIFRRVKGVQ
jgi:hypothetical protein